MADTLSISANEQSELDAGKVALETLEKAYSDYLALKAHTMKYVVTRAESDEVVNFYFSIAKTNHS